MLFAEATQAVTGCIITGSNRTISPVRPPAITLSLLPTDTCFGSTVTVQALPSGFSTYEFFKITRSDITPSGPINTNTRAYTITDTTQFVVRGINVCGDSSLSDTLLVYPAQLLPSAPVVTCGPSTFNSVTFDWTAVPEAVRYERRVRIGSGTFNGPSGDTDFTYTQTPLSSGQAVTIRVRAVGPAPCSTPTAYTELTCFACPQMDFTLNDTSVCNNQTANIKVRGVRTISSQYIFQYFVNNTLVATTKDSSIFYNATVAGNLPIRVVLRDTALTLSGCVDSLVRNAVLNVLSDTLTNPVVSRGSSRDTSFVTFNWTSVGGAAYEVITKVNNMQTNIDTISGTTYQVNNLNAYDSVDVCVRAVSAACNASSDTICAGWRSCPRLNFDFNVVQAPCVVGDTLTLQITDVETLTTNYLLNLCGLIGGTLIPGTPKGIISIATTANTINFTGTLTDTLITVNDCPLVKSFTYGTPPFVPASSYQPDSIVCVGQTVTIGIAPSNLASYELGGIVQSSPVFVIPNITTDTAFAVFATDTNGCKVEGDSARIFIYTVQAGSVTASTSQACNNDAVVFTANTAGNTPKDSLTFYFFDGFNNNLLKTGINGDNTYGTLLTEIPL